MRRWTKDHLPNGPFGQFQKKGTTRAVQMHDAFECITIDDNVASGKSGDWLALDAEGYPYPIARSVFEQTMVPVEPW